MIYIQDTSTVHIYIYKQYTEPVVDRDATRVPPKLAQQEEVRQLR